MVYFKLFFWFIPILFEDLAPCNKHKDMYTEEYNGNVRGEKLLRTNVANQSKFHSHSLLSY